MRKAALIGLGIVIGLIAIALAAPTVLKTGDIVSSGTIKQATTQTVFSVAGSGLSSSGSTVRLITTCSSTQSLVWNGSAWVCGSGGLTNGAGANVIPKSDGTNLVPSAEGDDGTTFTVNTNKFTVNESTGNASHAGTLGVTGLATLTAGFTLGADSSAGSHKITSLTNGSSAQDAAAFGQLATAVNAAVTGTANTTAKFTGTNAVGNAWPLDDATTWGVASKFTITEASGNFRTFGTGTVDGAFVGSSTGSLGGALNMNSHLINSVTDPASAQDGATKNYVDTASHISPSGSVIAATIATAVAQNNYAPSGWANTTRVLRINATSNATLTGLAAPTGPVAQMVWLDNLGSGGGSVVLKHENASSTATNRFNLVEQVDLQITSGGGALLIYDVTSTRWHVVSVNTDVFDHGVFVVNGGGGLVTFSADTSGNVTASGGISGNTLVTTSFVEGNAGVYSGSTSDAWIHNGGLGFLFATNAAATGFINQVGYAEGTTQFRNLEIDDGKGTGASHSILTTTGSGRGVAIGGDTSSVISFSNGPAGVNLYGGTHFEYDDEWLQAINGTIFNNGNPIGSSYTIYYSGTGTGLTTKTLASSRPGIAALTTGVATSGSYSTIVSDTNALKFATGSNFTYEWAGNWPTLSSSSATVPSMFISVVGFMDQTTTLTMGGCYFAYDKGNGLGVNASNVDALECWCTNGGGTTGYLINSSGNSDESFPLGAGAIVAATYYRLAIVVTATTRAEFYRNGVKVCDINTHIPTNVGFGFGQFPRASTGTGARSLETDRTTLKMDITARSP